MKGPVLGLVACAAGGIEDLRTELIEPMQADGWTVAVTLTPTASTWLRGTGEFDRIQDATGLPVRDQPRLPGESSAHPPADCFAVVPATANTVAKLAVGIADNQALTQVGEALGGGRPVVLFPRVNAAHARHAAWPHHLDVLRAMGVRLIYGDDVWALHEPRSASERKLPWHAIRAAIRQSPTL